MPCTLAGRRRSVGPDDRIDIVCGAFTFAHVYIYVWDVKTYRAVKNLYLLRTCIYIVYIVYIVLLYIYCIIISYCIILLIMFLLVGLSSFRYEPVQSVEFVTSCHFCIFCMVVYGLYFHCNILFKCVLFVYCVHFK